MAESDTITMTMRQRRDVNEGLRTLARREDRSINWVINHLLRQALQDLGVLPKSD